MIAVPAASPTATPVTSRPISSPDRSSPHREHPHPHHHRRDGTEHRAPAPDSRGDGAVPLQHGDRAAREDREDHGDGEGREVVPGPVEAVEGLGRVATAMTTRKANAAAQKPERCRGLGAAVPWTQSRRVPDLGLCRTQRSPDLHMQTFPASRPAISADSVS